MKITEVNYLQGRNVYSHRPVMKITLALGNRAAFRTDHDTAFTARLLGLLPGLGEHHCSRRCRGGFTQRLREGTYLGHVVEHVLLELQTLAGIAADYGKTIMENDTATIICETPCPQATEQLAAGAVEIVMAAMDGKKTELKKIIAQGQKAAAEFLPGPSTAAILQEARRRKIPVMRLEEGTSLYRLGTGKYQKRIMASIAETTGSIAVDTAASKPLTKKILLEYGLPVPKGEVVRSAEEAAAAAELIGYPVAMKPDNGNQGKGVSLNIRTKEDVLVAFARAAAFSPYVMVESYLQGAHYRLLVINGELCAAASRLPAFVTGDGSGTVRQLVARENKNPLRGVGHSNYLSKIVIDPIVLDVLAKQNLTLKDIPERGRRVLLRENANLSTGGIAFDVTDDVHPQQAALAVRAAEAVGLDIAGVDLVMKDISAPPDGQGGGIIEVNAGPGLRMHLHPAQGKKRDVGKKIVDMLFPPGAPTRVPVIAVTGTNGKTTTTRMLDYVLRRHGHKSGMCTTDGIFINGELLRQGDMSGPAGAQAVLASRSIDAAVLEVARGGIIRRGLGYDQVDVAVILNIRPDHLGQDGLETLDDLIHVKSLVAEAVYPTGAVVLNADEEHVRTLAGRVWAEIIYTSTGSDNPAVRQHLEKEGRALFIHRNTIVAAHGSRLIPVGRTGDFAVTYGGRATHLAENLLAALAAAWGFGLSPRRAGYYLRSFAADLRHNPGRANLFKVNNFHVMVDYGHNADGIYRTGQLAAKMGAKKTIAVVGVPGDRNDELIMASGEAAGRCFDRLIIKEDEDLRGRKPMETAGLLKRGALLAGCRRQNIRVAASEKDAVRMAFASASAGDLVIIFYEKLNLILSEIQSHSAGKPAPEPHKAAPVKEILSPA